MISSVATLREYRVHSTRGNTLPPLQPPASLCYQRMNSPICLFCDLRSTNPSLSLRPPLGALHVMITRRFHVLRGDDYVETARAVATDKCRTTMAPEGSQGKGGDGYGGHDQEVEVELYPNRGVLG